MNLKKPVILLQNILPGSCGVLPGLVGDVAGGVGSLNSGLIRLVLGIGLIIAAELAVVTAGNLIFIRRGGLMGGDQIQLLAELFQFGSDFAQSAGAGVYISAMGSNGLFVDLGQVVDTQVKTTGPPDSASISAIRAVYAGVAVLGHIAIGGEVGSAQVDFINLALLGIIRSVYIVTICGFRPFFSSVERLLI